MIRPRTHLHLLHRRAQQTLARVVDHAELAALLPVPYRRCIAMRSPRAAPAAADAPLPRARGSSRMSRRAGRRTRLRRLVIDARHFDMDVNAIQQWTADALLIAQDIRQRAGAFFHRVVKVTARAQGFIEATSMKFAGNVSEPCARLFVSSGVWSILRSSQRFSYRASWRRTRCTRCSANHANPDVTIRVRNSAVQDKFDARAIGDLGAYSGPPPAGLPRTE